MKITLDVFKQMLNSGAKSVDIEHQYINDLNVFPVPDGDTGVNLKTTLNGALENLKNKEINNFFELKDQFSRNLLMNARGNSGVIFSQIMRGFCSEFSTKQKELKVSDLIKSFNNAKLKAYSSVANPVEGTILTVVRFINEYLQKNVSKFKNVNTLFKKIVEIGDDALNKTPQMLEELAQVGVVDSGGYGLMSFIKGMNAYLQEETDTYFDKLKDQGGLITIDHEKQNFFDHKKQEEGFGYCSEIVLKLNAQINPNETVKKINFDQKVYLRELEQIGDSLVCIHDEEIVKVHIHTMNPHKLLEISQKYGEFEKIKFENMTNQYLEKKALSLKKVTSQKAKNKGIDILAVVPTIEISKLFIEQYGVKDTLITEDQGSPSIQDFVNKAYEMNSGQLIIVTDDSNIILTALEAEKMLSSEVKVCVIPSKNVFESLNVITSFDNALTLKQNQKEMTKTLKKSISALISTSIKDVEYSHIKVKKNEKIGIVDKKIISSSKDYYAAMVSVLDELMKTAKNIDICYVIYGKNVSLANVKKFEKYASETYGLFCEIQWGNQSVYDVYLGLE